MFRFTIRDMLWLTVVVALVVAYCVERSQRAAANKEHAAQLEMIRLEEARARYYAELQRAQSALLVPDPNQPSGGN